MRSKLLYNFGYIGIGKYNSTSAYYIYICWKNMIKRCYSKSSLANSPTYVDISIDERFRDFQFFVDWCLKNNYDESYHLDKDILIKGNKIYSPETCCFVPPEINVLFEKSKKSRGIYPIGVSLCLSTKKYRSLLNIKHNTKHLGYFFTIDEAFNKYKFEKEKYIKEMADKWKDKISDNVYQAMYNYKVEITD